MAWTSVDPSSLPPDYYSSSLATSESAGPTSPTTHPDLQELLQQNIQRLHNTYRKVHQYKVSLGKDMPIELHGWHEKAAKAVGHLI
jgi:hypothetical protein